MKRKQTDSSDQAEAAVDINKRYRADTSSSQMRILQSVNSSAKLDPSKLSIYTVDKIRCFHLVNNGGRNYSPFNESKRSEKDEKLERMKMYTIARGFAGDYPVSHAIREFVQNCHDGCLRIDSMFHNRQQSGPGRWITVPANSSSLNTQRYFYMIDNYCAGYISWDPHKQLMQLHNYGRSLLKRYLNVGAGDKKESKEEVGKFGTGLKYGITILAKEGLGLMINTNKQNWRFSFIQKRKSDGEQLAMKQTHAPSYDADQVQVTISEIPPGQVDMHKFLFLVVSRPFAFSRC